MRGGVGAGERGGPKVKLWFCFCAEPNEIGVCRRIRGELNEGEAVRGGGRYFLEMCAL